MGWVKCNERLPGKTGVYRVRMKSRQRGSMYLLFLTGERTVQTIRDKKTGYTTTETRQWSAYILDGEIVTPEEWMEEA